MDEPGGMLGSSNVEVITITPQTLPNPITAPVAPTIRKQSKLPAEKPGYRVGVGDMLKINIYTFDGAGDIQRIYPSGDYDAVSSSPTVKEDGKIALPYVGEVVLQGRTQGEIVSAITEGMKKYFKRVQVDVRVMEYNSQHVVVTGEVATPGEQKLTVAELRVLGAISAAGGVTAQADMENAEVRHEDGSVDTVNLMTLYNKGDQSQNRVLRAGDTVLVPQNHRNKVFIAGEVVKPQAMPIPKGRLTLAEALMESGGLDKITASKSNIYVIRGGVADSLMAPPSSQKGGSIAREQAELRAKVYKLSMEQPESYVLADQFLLSPRDVVYVSSRSITEWDRFISQLIPASIQSILYGVISN